MFELFLKILFFPIWFPIILVISILLFVISFCIAVLGFSVFVLFASLLFAGFVVALVGFINLVNNFFTSILAFGVTLILLGFGILLAVFGVNMCTKIIPNLLSAISGIFRKMFSIKKKYKYQPISNNETKELTTYEKIN